MAEPKRVIILGAAGRDFHNFNMVYRDNPDYKVVAFTATQIPGIEGRKYPKELAGKLYPKGIQILPEESLTELIKKFKVDEVVFAYSDVKHEYVMHKASEALAAGASFKLLGPAITMLKSKKPVISICAVRTGAGKSPLTRSVAKLLRDLGHEVAILRHPMPYGDLKKQVVQRFASLEDLDKHQTTVEEKEDYEPHIRNGFVVYAGVDYEKILREAEKEADIVIFEGGNNDYSFINSDLEIVIADALRPGHEVKYHPGETNTRMADILVINKVDVAKQDDIKLIENNVKKYNAGAKLVYGKLVPKANEEEQIRNKRALVVEDGPTVTHGGMAYGAGYIMARKMGAKEIVDPRKYAVGSIKETLKKYTHLINILPAVGYSKAQLSDLEETINKVPCDIVVVATPANLENLIRIKKPVVRVTYEFEETNGNKLNNYLKKFCKIYATK